jgi:hypothetical protein
MNEVSIGFFSLTYSEGFLDMIYLVINRECKNTKNPICAMFLVPYLIGAIEKINYTSEFIYAEPEDLFLIEHERNVRLNENNLDKVSVHPKKSEIEILINILNKNKCFSPEFSKVSEDGLAVGIIELHKFAEKYL